MRARASTAPLARRQRLACLVLFIQAAAAMCCATAAEIHWRTDNFTYVAQNKALKDLIRDFAAAQGLSVVIAPDVEGTVNGKFNLTPQDMLDLLATSFGVTWYYDGTVLYVSPAGDLSSEIVQLGATTPAQLQDALAHLGVLDRRYPLNYDRAHDTARVAGPKRYVELIKQAVTALNQSGGGYESLDAAATRTEIRVFPLRYAWAADFSYSADGEEHTLPGVVSVLRDLYTPTRVATSGTATAHRGKLDRLRGMGYFRDEQVPGSQPTRLDSVTPTQESAGLPESVPTRNAPSGAADLPRFQADGRMNAVVIRDVPERMALYGPVIDSLDIKPGLVEIEARILEINSDSISSLGIDWRAHSGSANLRINPGASPYSSPTSSGTVSGSSAGGIPSISTPGITAPLIIPPSQLPAGGALTTVLGDAGHYLMARVNALAEDGKANVLSNPRVMTLDNVEAVLENLNTFFVPVAGNLDTSLYNVSAGTSLRVTPLIVTEDGKTQIKLAVRIEDGGITQQTVGSLPVIQRTTITTQAFINEGESLLIGGYKSNLRNDTTAGVPGLSSVPVLGNLFKHRQKETSSVEHLFMLTPHVVKR